MQQPKLADWGDMKKLIALLLLLPLLASAEPGKTTRWLMNERATLFEIGFMRAEGWIQSEEENFGEHYFHVSGVRADSVWTYALYIHDDDNYLFGVGFSDSKSTVELMKSTCEEILQRYFGVMRIKLRHWFTHYIDAPGGLPDDFFNALESRSKMECRVTRKKGAPNLFAVSLDMGTQRISVTMEDEKGHE